MELEELELLYEKTKNEFELLKSIVSPNNISLKVNLNEIENIIFKDIPNTLKDNAPSNFPELYFNFKSEYERFRDFILYEYLIGKNIVALGGGFSSGKSSFLNSLLGKKFLPCEIDPSTSVPAYIVNSNEVSVFGINTFNSKIKLSLKDVLLIAHGFGKDKFDEDTNIKEITLGHILNSLFIATPLQIYSNIAFLDTPGYSKSDTENYSSKTDEKIARNQLNLSNYILWFIQADSGGITEEDINFLNTIKKEIPKLIILNKADKVTQSDLSSIVTRTKSVLDIKGVPYIDVLTYSRNNPKGFDSEKIRNQLQKWNVEIYEENFAYNFKQLFVALRAFYNKNKDIESIRLSRINTALTLSNEDIVKECLFSLKNETVRNINNLKETEKQLKKLQDDFFTILHNVGSAVGIKLPEPTEIDLIKDKIINPLSVIEDYIKKKNIKVDPNIYTTLSDKLLDIKPVINKLVGGSEYKDKLFNVLKQSFVIKENIKIHNKLQ